MQVHALASAALLALWSAPAAAHETLHEVQRGKATSVRVYFADGEPLAYAAYEVYSPADAKFPHQKGLTDRKGWAAFVPDVPGRWHVKIIDASGHGLDIEVDAEAPGASLADPAASVAAGSGAAFVLRPLVGLGVIGAVFGALFLAWRKQGSAR